MLYLKHVSQLDAILGNNILFIKSSFPWFYLK